MKPIILTADEVRAALAGTLTEIRRPVKPQPVVHPGWVTRMIPGAPLIDGIEFAAGTPKFGIYSVDYLDMYADDIARRFSPFGAPGTVLWVKERHASMSKQLRLTRVAYRADMMVRNQPHCAHAAPWPVDNSKGRGYAVSRWCSAGSMPLRFSRLAIVTRSVRVERAAVWTWIASVEVGRKENGEPMPPREVKS